jgi:flagellar biosynthetic protein FliP
MGANQMPPSQLLVGLSLILTFFIMTPVANKAYTEGIKPYIDEQISGEEAYDLSVAPFKKFMLSQTREQDLALFVDIAGLEAPDNADDIPLHVLIPGFVISELRTAFQIAFVIFIPFLVIDMVVASVLMSMGMMMLPPIIVSLPFKILLFVLVDGWYLLIKSLVESFHM